MCTWIYLFLGVLLIRFPSALGKGEKCGLDRTCPSLARGDGYLLTCLSCLLTSGFLFCQLAFPLFSHSERKFSHSALKLRAKKQNKIHVNVFPRPYTPVPPPLSPATSTKKKGELWPVGLTCLVSKGNYGTGRGPRVTPRGHASLRPFLVGWR